MGIVVLPSSSRKSLDALAEGSVHAASVHLRDAKGGEYNLEPVRRAAGKKPMVLFNFASWEVGLGTAKSGPHQISKLAELARADVRIINREAGWARARRWTRLSPKPA
jgi:molybdate-binding protein